MIVTSRHDLITISVPQQQNYTAHLFQSFSSFKRPIIIMIVMMCLWNIVKIFIINIVKVTTVLLCTHQLNEGNGNDRDAIPQLHVQLSETVNSTNYYETQV